MRVIGGRAMEVGALRVRVHTGGPQCAKMKVEVIAEILASIKDAEGWTYRSRSKDQIEKPDGWLRQACGFPA